MEYKISFIAKRNFKSKESNESFNKGVIYIKNISFSQLRDIIKLAKIRTNDYEILDISNKNQRVGV